MRWDIDVPECSDLCLDEHVSGVCDVHRDVYLS